MSCYGRNIVGRSWADDEDDEWDAGTFAATTPTIGYYTSTNIDAPAAERSEQLTATAANVEHDGSASVNATASEADSDITTVSKDNSSSSGSGTTATSTLHQADDNLPARPATPEPVTEGAHSDSNGTDDDAASAEDTQTAQPPYLKKFGPDNIPCGFHPSTPFWLSENGPYKPTVNAYPELLWETPNYLFGWNLEKVNRALKVGEPLFSSPLRNEVLLDELEEDQYDFSFVENEVDLETELAQVDDWELSGFYSDLKIEDAQEQVPGEDDEVLEVTSCSVLQDEETTVTGPDHTPKVNLPMIIVTFEDELATVLMEAEGPIEPPTIHDNLHTIQLTCQDELATGSMESEGHIEPQTLHDSLSTIRFTCEDELAAEETQVEDNSEPTLQNNTEDLTPSKGEDSNMREKHDSFLEVDEYFVPGLFDEDEVPLSPASSAVVSTDEEVDMVQISPLVFPINNQDNDASCIAEKEPSPVTAAVSLVSSDVEVDTPSAVLLVATPSTDDTSLVTTQDGQDVEQWIPKIDEDEVTTKDGVRAAIVSRPIQGVILQYFGLSPSAMVKTKVQEANSGLCRRLQAQYLNVRMTSMSAHNCMGSKVLQTLAERVVF